MNVRTITLLAAAMFYSIAAHAHDCSGGAAGGMDATGNQCNAEFINADAATTMPTVTSKLAPATPSAHSHAMAYSKSHAKSKRARHAGSKQSARGLT